MGNLYVDAIPAKYIILFINVYVRFISLEKYIVTPQFALSTSALIVTVIDSYIDTSSYIPVYY